MRLTMLGSGGVNPAPRATCFCRVCELAREKGIPHARTGCSLFIDDAKLLFDTPEEIRQQLNREKISGVEHLILTHWHPDHTHGIRILEQINWNFEEGKPYKLPIKVYISSQQQEWFKKYSCGAFLDFYVKRGMIEIIPLEHKRDITIGDVTVRPYLIEHTKGFAFVVTQGSKKAVYIPCEYHHVIPDPEIKNADIFIAHNLFWENEEISPRKTPPADEDSFETMLKHADAFGTKKIVLTHIEESFQLDHDEMNEKMKKHYPDYQIQAGYDGMKIII